MTVTTPHPFHGRTFYFATKHGKEEPDGQRELDSSECEFCNP